VKALKALPVVKAEGVAVADKRLIVFLLFFGLSTLAISQELPADELQVNISGYFDSFDVNVLYPSISLTNKVSDNTSVTGRYLVDMITAASMKSSAAGGGAGSENERESDDVHRTVNNSNVSTSTSKVDAVTAASARGGYGGEGEGISFDDVRHEFNLGVTHLFYDNTLSLNGIYSTEFDYTSATLAGTIAHTFAMKNTTLELGFVRSWDRIFPVTKNWTRSKDVVTYSANFSQILGPDALLQLLTSYTENNGYLADAYNQVNVDSAGTLVQHDPIHPDNRIRRAAASRFKFRINELSSMQLGYRYYWDNWDIVSQTFSLNYMRHLSKHTILGLGWRGYQQNKAYFFKKNNTLSDALITSDVKLDKGFSNELQLDFIVSGGRNMDYLPFLTNERVQYTFSMNIYQRHTDTGYWFNGSKNLIATNFNIGLRYRF
jgi:Protein of unknown function (DUF3570)